MESADGVIREGGELCSRDWGTTVNKRAVSGDTLLNNRNHQPKHSYLIILRAAYPRQPGAGKVTWDSTNIPRGEAHFS